MTVILDTLAFEITPAGFFAPEPAAVVESMKASFRSIYGADAMIDADSQDGQWLAIVAQAINDCNQAAGALYAAFQPDGAIGVGLSASVKINGLLRQPATNSQVDLTLTGTPGTVIVNGKVRDAVFGYLWALPASVTIPSGSSIVATAVCVQPGAINLGPHTINIINSPIAGWATADNPADATPGVDAESDAQLRMRQTQSVALPGQTRLDAMVGAVRNVAGVQEVAAYENTTGTTDANGLPEHSIGLVISGGDATDIAFALVRSKTPGAYMYGSTTQTVTDDVGVPQTMRWTVPTNLEIRINIALTALAGYTTDVGSKIAARLQAYVGNIPSGQPVYWSRLFKAALLTIDNDGTPVEEPDPDADSYDITLLQQDVLGGAGYSEANIVVPFGQQAHVALANIHFTVT